MLHAIEFLSQVAVTEFGEAVGLPAARRVILLEALNPTNIEQAVQRTIERASAQLNAALTHVSNFLKERVTVAGFVHETEKDKQYGFGEWQGIDMLVSDMSHDDILSAGRAGVNRHDQAAPTVHGTDCPPGFYTEQSIGPDGLREKGQDFCSGAPVER